jgi:hypothetical protein
MSQNENGSRAFALHEATAVARRRAAWQRQPVRGDPSACHGVMGQGENVHEVVCTGNYQGGVPQHAKAQEGLSDARENLYHCNGRV